LTSVRDIREVAEREAALDQTNATLAARIKNRTAALSATNVKLKRSFEELGQTQRQLVDASRRAGMAEVATSVLHNVGNVLNSLNVSASLVTEGLERSPSLGIVRVNKLVTEHIGDLFAFLVTDERGRQLPNYLDKLADAVSTERDRLIGEMHGLQRSIDHIKTIVAMQQSNAKLGGLIEEVALVELLDDAVDLTLKDDPTLVIERDFIPLPPLYLYRHKIMDIVINLMQNARRALHEVDGDGDKRVTLRVQEQDGFIAIAVSDNGVGIAHANLAKIFTHGFTTHQEGHGFGLHASANSAASMGGRLLAHSDGPGNGATFTLLVPNAARPAVKAA
jgi:C4-dicarboxylate-specific signal transduction histidine kinase